MLATQPEQAIPLAEQWKADRGSQAITDVAEMFIEQASAKNSDPEVTRILRLELSGMLDARDAGIKAQQQTIMENEMLVTFVPAAGPRYYSNAASMAGEDPLLLTSILMSWVLSRAATLGHTAPPSYTRWVTSTPGSRGFDPSSFDVPSLRPP